MKKGWKIFWIVCACIAGLGAALCIAGVVLGATFSGIYDRMWKYGSYAEKKLEIIEKKQEDIEDFWEDDWEDDFSENISGTSGNIWASVEDIGELEVEVSYLKVEIEESESGEITFLTHNIPSEVEEELVFTQDGDEMKVHIRNEKSWRRAMNNRGETAVLTIRIPKEHRLRDMALSIGAGELEADHIQVHELDVAVGAGAAEIDHFTVDSLEIKVGAGEARINGTVAEEASIECGIGTVDYQASGSMQDYSYDLEVGAGTITIGDQNYSGVINEKKIRNGGTVMDIECGIGTVTVSFDE